MVEIVEPIDLFLLLKTGQSGPMELGVMNRDAVRALVEPEDIRADNHFRHADPASPWCIYGINCEFFFSPDFRLRHIKLLPGRSFFGFGGEIVRWTGKLALDAGRHPVNFGGASPLELHALPDALAFLHKAELSGPVGAGLDRTITIELIDEPRRLTLGYEVAVLPVEGTKHVAHEIDYFLSAVWMVDESLPGE
ncbi:hypothetical protein [Kumtagia ephedrae]|uniref:Uncharacterized protein n=1 Tax=Kumtagia ephedrae TaxID=2116701 RepID=A0A2P7S860_9HYPH|nr:hypothetical protein [Mesorhizobium ephedrae]PSJ58682.1 hypothetical protein C7I84_14430 [Mesorhizobium ephedrae]